MGATGTVSEACCKRCDVRLAGMAAASECGMRQSLYTAHSVSLHEASWLVTPHSACATFLEKSTTNRNPGRLLLRRYDCGCASDGLHAAKQDQILNETAPCFCLAMSGIVIVGSS